MKTQQLANLALTAALLAIPSIGIPTRFGHFSSAPRHEFDLRSRISQPFPVIGQDDDDDANENTVPPKDVDKYISVYKAMRRNRSLTVEQAATVEGLTLKQFRQLEDRIQRDDNALQRVRDQLQAAARESPKSGPTP
jgi:hypothetical protein